MSNTPKQMELTVFPTRRSLLLLFQCCLFLSCLTNFIQLRNALADGAVSPSSQEQNQIPTISYKMSTIGRRNLRAVGRQLLEETVTTTSSAVVTPPQEDEPASTTTSSNKTPAAVLPSTAVPVRMLLGIFTMDTPNDFNRRRLIRRTYLSYYDQLNSVSNVTGLQPKNRMCALADLIAGNATNADDCQLVYTFVLAGADPSDPQASTELLDDDLVIPMTLEGPSRPPTSTTTHGDHEQEYERDLTFLNIKENMNEGKTLTWFKYASSHLPADLQIDLIAKVDTDTVVYPDEVLEEVENKLRAKKNLVHPPKLVYGGHGITERHYYMQGGFYFLSGDLAKYITSDACPRDEIVQGHIEKHGHRAEDREVGAYIKRRERSPQAIKAQRLYLPEGVGSAHYSRLKDAAAFRVKWKEFFATIVADLAYDSLPQTKANSSTTTAANSSSIADACQTQDTINKALDNFDRALNVKRAREEFMKLVKPCETVVASS